MSDAGTTAKVTAADVAIVADRLRKTFVAP